MAYSLKTDASGIYVVKWRSSPVTMQVKLSGTANLSDGSSFRSSVVAAMEAWNAQLGTVKLSAQSMNPSGYVTGNGVNEVVMDSSVSGQAFSPGMLAVTLSYTSGNGFGETDIVFNTSGVSWDSYRGSRPRAGKEDIRRVAIHELGHALGLDHPDDAGQSVTAVMNSTVSNIDALTSDDIAGGQRLYGAPGFVPANDAFASASAISFTGESYQTTGTNIAASRQAGEPAHQGVPAGHSVWWKWTASARGEVTITTFGSDFDTVLAVYTGASVSALTLVESNDDEETPEQNPTSQRKRTSRVMFDAESGVTYWIAVDGWGDADEGETGYTGRITLNVEFGARSAPTFSTQPTDQTVTAGYSATFTAVPSGVPYPTLQWQRRPAAGGAWQDLPAEKPYIFSNEQSLVVFTTYAMNGDQFRCVATTRFGTAVSAVATLRVEPRPLPVITEQPRDVVGFVGYPAFLHLLATEAWSYRWFKDGELVVGTDEQSSALSLNPARLADSGRYRAEVTNPGGAVLSDTVTVKIVAVTPVRSVHATEHGAMLLREDGSRWLVGDFSSIPRPLVRPGEDALIAAAASQEHDLAVISDGTLWYWRGGPMQVATDVVKVAAGKGVSFYIKKDGTLWGFSTDSSFPLGDGTPTSHVLIAESVQSVSTTYGFAVFIKVDGSLWGFGSNYYGQLGDGTFGGTRQTPVKIADDVVAAHAGRSCTLFVRRDGSAWTVGRNAQGQLGDGTRIDRATPVRVLEDVASVAAGEEHTLFLKKDGTLWASGWVAVQFGFGLGEIRSTPVKVGSGVVQMSAGPYCSYYVKADGTVWATGENLSGQLGLGVISDYEATPQLMLNTGHQREAPIAIEQRPPIREGTPIGDWHFGARSVVGGTFTFSPAPGTVLPRGTHTVTATFTPHDSFTYRVTTIQTTLTVTDGSGRIQPSITWNDPAPMAAGESLSGTQLNAVASVPGTFSYSPDLWTKLRAGTHTLTVTFTPADSTAYTTATKQVAVKVEGQSDTRLVALSARCRAGGGDQTLIMGFVVDGAKQVLVQGVGPGIASSVPTAIADPQLKLYRWGGGAWTQVAENNDWVSGAEILDARGRLGASAMAQGSKDAALLKDLDAGVYTAHVASGGAAGVALVEAYDADAGGGSRLMALSTRTVAGAGDDTLIVGMVLEGPGPKTVLVRGLGPTLATRDGVSGVLSDPRLKLFRMAGGSSTLIGENDDWGGTAEMKEVFAGIGAGPIASDASKDAAMLVTLEPGVYTVHVTGAAGTTGVALVEIFDVE